MSESQRRVQKVLRSSASSTTRVLGERAALAKCLADKGTRDALKQVVKPNSLSRTLRKAGVALILAPDPVTAVPGVAMLGASFAMRGKKPLSPASVFEDTRALLAEIGSSI
jgi:hypothetical protein